VTFLNLFKIIYTVERAGSNTYQIAVTDSAIFSNFMGLKSEIAAIPAGKTVIIDFSKASFIDHTVMEFVDHFRADYNARGGDCSIVGLENHEPFSDHPLAARRAKPNGNGKGRVDKPSAQMMG
jgi:MFS superfamily sulfate permease-like transporter